MCSSDLTGNPALAHHSANAEFDTQKEFTISGTLTKLENVNPHSWWYVDVKGADGKVTTWNMELTSPNTIRRQGWGPDDLLAGDKVIFEGFGGKVVESRGSLQTIMKVSDMKPLFGPGGPDAAK